MLSERPMLGVVAQDSPLPDELCFPVEALLSILGRGHLLLQLILLDLQQFPILLSTLRGSGTEVNKGTETSHRIQLVFYSK